MSDEQEEVPIPQNSKCYTCRHGFVLADKDIQSFFQPAMVEGNGFDGQPDQPGLNQMEFPIEKIRSICFWRPAALQTGMISPLIFNCVTECSKYEKN